MGVETEIFAGKREDLESALATGPSSVDGLPTFFCSPLDQVSLCSLGQLLIAGGFERTDESTYGAVYDRLISTMIRSVAEDDAEEGPWIFPIPDELTLALSALPEERFLAIAEEWRQTEEVGGEWGLGDEAPEFVRLLSELARAANRTDRSLYLWASL